MLKGGEDPLFIARRLVISAAEDIGNADPQALVIAVAASQAVQLIGLPRAGFPWPRRQPTSPPLPKATLPTWPLRKPSLKSKRVKVTASRFTCAGQAIAARQGWAMAKATSTPMTTPGTL